MQTPDKLRKVKAARKDQIAKNAAKVSPKKRAKRRWLIAVGTKWIRDHTAKRKKPQRVTCKVCRCRVNKENLQKHLARVHPEKTATPSTGVCLDYLTQ